MAAPDWHRLCRGGQGLSLDASGALVTFASGRSQRVDVVETEEAYEIASVVARASVLREIRDAELSAWTHNRSTQLVGFRVDSKGRLIGESWVPRCGVTEEEFLLYLMRTASECDRFEYLLTGKNRE